jgi:prolipoprotein diacylglyceryltransferase
VSLVFRFGAFFVGAVAGGVIGARIFSLIVTGTDKVLLTVVWVLVFAGLSGLLASRYRGRFLMWATALGGAGLALAGLGRIAPDALEFLRHPDTALEGVLSFGAWLALALVGRSTQLRLFPRTLRSGAGER